MLLYCPQCRHQHIDAPDPESGWENPPHKSHLCAHCGLVWRPCDLPTTGVSKIRTAGKNDSWFGLKPPEEQDRGMFVSMAGDEPEFHETRLAALLDARQAIDEAFDPETLQWTDAAATVFVAQIIAVSQPVDVVERPPAEELDSEGFDKSGIEWAEGVEYICDFELVELSEPDGSENAIDAITLH